ncbi:hypothetical protein [Alkalimonas sp.]|uniref:hypothetical protein n=1 Tax=Alkalimonas sp. TaxID=1872453 RepID=UPI00263B8232|nr:hypothetical protein [Alkalimonas sp.]MCC5825372.1 hypothetical protein [Alkalimonas sp.]
MTITQANPHYSGIYVNDVWQNSYLVSKDLLTCHDLTDCEYSVLQCPLQAEYFLQQMEPAVFRQQNLLEIYRYAQGITASERIPSPEQMLKFVAEIISKGDLRVFKIRDGNINSE